MERSGFVRDVAGISALNEPVRRELYLFVSKQDRPVSRDQAADGVGVPRHTAKFHLDKLVEDGLLDTEFKRLTGRQGPGAGRPTKLYRRSDTQFEVTLPERHYDLAGHLMAQAIDDSTRTGKPVVNALHVAAAELGTRLAGQARDRVTESGDGEQRVAIVCDVLTAHGYEPRQHDRTITLVNCPFHLLAQEHTELICGMNLALLGAVAGFDGGGLTATLDPGPGRCCVLLTVS